MKIVRTVLGVILAAMIFAFGFLSVMMWNLNAKFDSLPKILHEEFRTMRSEMAAQVNAISGAITATRQPPTPQIVVVPPPAPARNRDSK